MKPLPFVVSVGLGLALRYLVAKPASVTTQAWQLLAIFLSTIAGLVLSPLPVGAWAFLGLTVTFAAAFGAFTNDVIWLIVISFFFARGFVKTGLGDRMATHFVKLLGKSTLGLSFRRLGITNNLSLLPQVIMLVLLVLKIVGDGFNDVVYQLHVQIKKIPFLEEHPLSFMQHLIAHDAIMGPLV
jgi:di/tricarboxylate transporter